jgi:hypothetical protein
LSVFLKAIDIRQGGAAMTDNTKYLQIIERVVKAAAKRVGNADESDLAHFVSIRDLMDEQIKFAVELQRRDGKSWSDIGSTLGVSKQAAMKGFNTHQCDRRAGP